MPAESLACPSEASPAALPGLPLLVVDRGDAAGAPRAESASVDFAAAPWRAALAGAALVLLLLGAALAGRSWRTAPGTLAATPGRVPPAQVLALGRLAPLGELRVLAAPFGAGDAPVAELHVREGQQVAAGARLVTFGNSAARQAALQVAERQLASREAALLQAEREVSSAQAQVAAERRRAELVARAATLEYQRWEALSAQDFVSPTALDQRRTQRDEALELLARAQAGQARHAGDAATQPDLRLAQKGVEAARAELDRARQDLAGSVLRAPHEGTVIALRSRVGERPGASGVLEFGDTRVMTAELEVHQDEVRHLRAGLPVSLEAPALGTRLQGHISQIGLSVGRQRLTEASPAANTDARVLRVTVQLDPASSARARSLVGLELRARIALAPVAP